ncbi:MAG: hypothetical protein CMJ62_09350 [Planctomycetaceae bacterium]|nr:hypothetical protein [Planctomycetaceae bacterium]
MENSVPLLPDERKKYNQSMTCSDPDPFHILREIGAPDYLRAAIQSEPMVCDRKSNVQPRFNAHIHLPPNFSAFETVQQAVDLADSQGISVLGASNYYDYSVYEDFARRVHACGIFPLFGLEIICLDDQLRDAGIKVNDPGNPGKMYVCGKGITRFGQTPTNQMTDEASRLLDKIRRNDSTRMSKMVERLDQTFSRHGLDMGIDEDNIIEMIVQRHQSPPETVYLQERHVCQAFQERLFQLVPAGNRIATLKSVLAAQTKSGDPEDSVAIQNDIRSHLLKTGKPAFVEETFVKFDEAMRLILELGGIPCYPTLADGTSPICPFEASADQLIVELKNRNIHAAELIPVRNSINVASHYIRAYRDAGMFVTSGTEHNTLDCIGMEPVCQDGRFPSDVQDILWEGTCVVAAHQFLVLHGQCGFVNNQGNPNPEYSSDEQRINELANLGAAVIARYTDHCSQVINVGH